VSLALTLAQALAHALSDCDPDADAVRVGTPFEGDAGADGESEPELDREADSVGDVFGVRLAQPVALAHLVADWLAESEVLSVKEALGEPTGVALKPAVWLAQDDALGDEQPETLVETVDDAVTDVLCVVDMLGEAVALSE